MLRPTLVYNCKNVPALCNNVGQYLPAGVNTRTLHYDSSPQRVGKRRDTICPTGWTDNQINGQDRCPAANQPQWRYAKLESSGRTFAGPLDIEMYRGSDNIISPNRLAKKEENRKLQDDGQWITETKYYKYGAVLSCDEWPAASTIEGGNGDVKPSTTYCKRPSLKIVF